MRGAYEVGVILGIVDALKPQPGSPPLFRIFSGASARLTGDCRGRSCWPNAPTAELQAISTPSNSDRRAELDTRHCCGFLLSVLAVIDSIEFEVP